VHICPLLVPHAKAAELVQPCECTFHNPAPSSQAATMFRIAHREEGQSVTGTQSTADFLRVVGSVPEHAVRTTARPTTWSLKGRHGIEQR
jgi:hypothetical protein